MEPIIPSNQPISVSPQALNPPDASSRTALSASDIIEKLMDKVSFAILGITDKKSTVVSSASLAPVLGMVLASMEDNAKKELLLGLPLGSLTEELEIEIHQKLGEFSKDHPYDETHKTISAANFVATASSTKDEYLERILPECYQTQTLENGDMNVADATDTFVNEKTKGKIKTLFDGFSEFDRKQVSVVLGNVMEFRGIWETSFSPDKTAPGRFLCADGTRIENVKKMCTTEDFHFANDGEFTAIAKEFRSENGEDLKLVAIAPNETSATAINNLDSGTINHLIGKLEERKTEITLDLPIIEVENSGDTELLEKITHALGTSIKAQDLSRLDPSPSYALRMVQKIKVSVDEQGAHSSIATAATAQSRGGAQDFFNIDCPSYIAIVDSKGNRLLELVIKDGSFLVPDGSPCDLLKKISRALGISIEAEDLSRLGQLSRQELNIIQKIKTSIDEKGAQGAIATAAAIDLRECFIEPDEEEPIPYFHFDCPGYIAI